MKAKIYVGAKKYALYIGRKIIQKTLEFLTLPARFISKKVQELKNLTMWGQSVQNGIPTPTAPVEIESVGDKTKNLFDKDNTTYGQGLCWGSTQNSITTSLYYASNIIPVKGGKTYTRSFTNTSANYFKLANGSFLNIVNKGLGSTGVTVVAPDNAIEYFFNSENLYLPENIAVVEGDSLNLLDKYKIPVEVGDTTTNIYLNEPLRKIGKYVDTLSVDGTDVTVVRNVGIFDTEELANEFQDRGNASSAYIGSQYISIFSYGTQISLTKYNFGGAYASRNHMFNVLCTKLVPLNVEFSQSTYKYGMTGIDSSLNLFIGTTKPADKNEMAQRIRDLGLELVLPLNAPTTETYTIENPIQLPQGTLTIDTDTNIKPSKINITGDIDNE